MHTKCTRERRRGLKRYGKPNLWEANEEEFERARDKRDIHDKQIYHQEEKSSKAWKAISG